MARGPVPSVRTEARLSEARTVCLREGGAREAVFKKVRRKNGRANVL